MAGIFGFFDFTKPGKGVDPDEPEKRALFRYLDIIWQKKGKLVTLNIIYFICILPIIIAFHLFAFEPFLDSIISSDQEYTVTLFTSLFLFVLKFPQIISAALLMLSVILLGPATCGLTYVLRNFVRKEHAWLSDFWQRAKMNFKQGVFLGILDAVMFYMGFFNLSVLFFGNESDISPIITVGAVIVFLIYLCMRNTLYLMAVTVELSNFELVRNALILAFDGFWRHLLTGLIYAVYIILILFVNSFIELAALPLFAFSLLGLTSVFICYPIVDKRLVQPQLKAENSSEEIQ